ncbi:DUF2934 domain-containing protein [Pararhizobium sp. BT-229]|uniref:DUF2934 domain-containing protein n=1 Tax=Pararhizobium sp. BT-229 TaxID=2986923 RepID=UPI0021F7562F|nr:DUF2934 domain-containing protein [Pararhizobium sp. BT-229]MCV9967112.1 DUF2934 domain-containing protein [Pararhizobium sp. BT-229]
MTEISENDIKKRAYALWEADGRPDGTHEAHWERALQELTQEAEAAAAGVAPKPKKASKLSVVKNDTMADPVPKKRSRKTT